MRAAWCVTAQSFYAGDLPSAQRAAEAAAARADEVGLAWSPHGYSIRGLLAVIRYTTGDFDRSTAGLPAARLSGRDPARDSLVAVGLYAAVARGDAGTVELANAVTAADALDPMAWLIASGTASDALRMRGEAAAASARARAGAERIAQRWGEWSLGGIWLAALGVAAEADLAAACRLRRDETGAQAHADTAREWDKLAQKTAVRGRPRGGSLGPEGRAWLLRTTAEADRAAGTPNVEAWERVVDAFDYGYPYEVARSRLRLPKALLASGQRDRAATELQAAVEVTDSLGAKPLHGEVVALARRARLDIGVRRPATALLTGRELEVLRLVATGKTSRQIGQHLFISEKTASVHVSRILAKLEVSGRAEAAAQAAQRGLLA